MNKDLLSVTKDVHMLLRQSSQLSEIAMSDVNRQLSNGNNVTVDA